MSAPPSGTPLCRLDDIEDPGTRGFRFGEGPHGFSAFVVRSGGAVAGYVDSCPHTGSPLSLLTDRYLTRKNDLIICATHGALFRPEDGVCIAGPCAGKRLRPWPVEVRDGTVTAA